ncbi:MAG: RDD family protein [Burkholderiaceae bacterium]
MTIAAADTATPSLRRRLLSMTYEAMLLFAVVFIAGYLFDTLTQSRNALVLRHARQAWLFAILGVYFVWFWVHGGQTLAMKTWQIRLASPDGESLDYARAIGRYLLLWVFVLPTLALLAAFDVQGWPAMIALGAALLVPPFYAWVDRDSQFIHDRILGTRLVTA